MQALWIPFQLYENGLISRNVIYLLTFKINTKTQVEISLVILTGPSTVADGYFAVWDIWCSKMQKFI